VTSIFKQKNQSTLLLLFFFGLLLKLPIFFNAKFPAEKIYDGFIYNGLADFFQPLVQSLPLLPTMVAYLLIFFQVYLITSFINNHRLMLQTNFLSGMAYLILTSLVKEFNILSPQLIASTIFIVVFILLFQIHNKKSVPENLLRTK
jgi:hypothetical protein